MFSEDQVTMTVFEPMTSQILIEDSSVQTEIGNTRSSVRETWGFVLLTPYIQDVSRLEDITAGGDFLGLCDQKSSYKHVSDFGRLRSYGHFLIPVHALV
jgi:hypothetical protein